MYSPFLDVWKFYILPTVYYFFPTLFSNLHLSINILLYSLCVFCLYSFLYNNYAFMFSYFQPTFLSLKKIKQDLLKHHEACVSMYPPLAPESQKLFCLYYFGMGRRENTTSNSWTYCFLCGPCHINGKQEIRSSQNFLLDKDSGLHFLCMHNLAVMLSILFSLAGKMGAY